MFELSGENLDELKDRLHFTVSTPDSWYYKEDNAKKILMEHFHTTSLLGIGLDGHIGFNEPADHFEKNTHCVELTESTIEANKRFFESKDEVPRQAYTMGILPIVQAKKVIMIANGKNKADIIKKAFTGPVTPEVPASILQMHPDFTLIADEDALSEI